MKRSKSIFLVVVIALLLSMVPISTQKAMAATDYYVSLTGNDIATGGNATHPWKTISYALLHVSSGTINVYAGIYEENIQLENGVAIVSDRSGDAIIKSPSGSTLPVVIANNVDSTARLDGFTITSGNASSHGGGLTIESNASPIISNCVIVENHANFHGGGIAVHDGSSPTIINCTITGNEAGYVGGGIWINESSPQIYNCIIVNNDANITSSAIPSGGVHVMGTSSSPTIDYNDVWNNSPDNYVGWSPASNDISEAPLFVDGYHLQTTPTISPCIDTGYNTEVNSLGISEDKDGNPRISNGTVDIGAYEVGEKTYYTLNVNIVGSGAVSLDPDEQSYAEDTVVTLTADPTNGWSFDSWSGDLAGSTNPETITMDDDKSVIATFTQDQYTLTIDTVGNGSVAKNPDSATYTHGETVELTATAEPGWSFDSWSSDLAGSTNPETITMDGDKSVIATFTQSSQGEDTFQNFAISRMTINFAKDTEKPDKKRGWRAFFSWFMKFTHGNADKFSVSGRVKLPEGYTVAHLEKSATVSVSINNNSGSDAVNFREQILRRLGVRWKDTGKSPGENMSITKMTIWWAPEEGDWAGWAGLNIQGELELPESIGVNTAPVEATVTLTIPVNSGSGGGSLLGEETIEFQVYSRSNQWYYNNVSLPFFRYTP